MPDCGREGEIGVGQLVIDEIRARSDRRLRQRRRLEHHELRRIGQQRGVDGDAPGKSRRLRADRADARRCKGALPSMNSGNSALPPASGVAVCVAEKAFTLTVLAAPSSSTRRVVPDGLETCRPAGPSAALSWVTTEASPPEKSTPITLSFGFGVTLSCERQRGRIVDPHDGDDVQRAGRGVGIGRD